MAEVQALRMVLAGEKRTATSRKEKLFLSIFMLVVIGLIGVTVYGFTKNLSAGDRTILILSALGAAGSLIGVLAYGGTIFKIRKKHELHLEAEVKKLLKKPLEEQQTMLSQLDSQKVEQLALLALQLKDSAIFSSQEEYLRLRGATIPFVRPEFFMEQLEDEEGYYADMPDSAALDQYICQHFDLASSARKERAIVRLLEKGDDGMAEFLEFSEEQRRNVYAGLHREELFAFVEGLGTLVDERAGSDLEWISQREELITVENIATLIGKRTPASISFAGMLLHRLFNDKFEGHVLEVLKNHYLNIDLANRNFFLQELKENQRIKQAMEAGPDVEMLEGESAQAYFREIFQQVR